MNGVIQSLTHYKQMSLGTGTLNVSGVPDAISCREVSMATLECRKLPNHNSHILVDQCSDRCLVTSVSVKAEAQG